MHGLISQVPQISKKRFRMELLRLAFCPVNIRGNFSGIQSFSPRFLIICDLCTCTE
jgi:hypothetical protein